MKKVLFLSLFLFPVMLLAQAASPVLAPSPVAVASAPAVVVAPAAPAVTAPAWAPPAWVINVLNWVTTLPTVGPVIVKILSILATVSVGMTLIATFVMGLLSGLSKSADLLAVFPSLAKLAAVSDSIDALYLKIVPYLQFFSMYNSQFKVPSVTASSSQSTPPTA